MTDEEIVQRILGGDSGFFAVLMARHHHRIFRVVRGIVRDANAIEDLVQQIYLNAYAHLNQFAGKSKFSTWLLRIAIHEALARVHEEELADRETSLEAAEELMDQRTNSGFNPEQLAFSHELQRVIESQILALPLRYRAVLVLRDIDGLSTAETAACLQVNAAVVRTRLKRARAMVRARLFKRMGISLDSLFRFLGDQCDRTVRLVTSRNASTFASRH